MSAKRIEIGLVQVQIVNFINWELTLSCIQSIKRQTYDNYRIVVIENASPNDSLERLKEFDSNLSTIVSGINVGWGAGLNLGFFHHEFDTEPEFYLTVNSDATLESDCLSKLVDTMKSDSNCAIVSPVIYEDFTMEKIHNVGFNLSYKYLVPLDFTKLTGNHKRCVIKSLKRVSWTEDTVALMRGSAICEVGGYDERYFMYGQMTDMGYRLKQKGFDFIVNYNARAFHAGKGSSGGQLSKFSLYYKFRNWCIFQKKHFKRSHLLYTLVWSIAVMFIYFVKVILQGNPALILTIGRGIKDGLTYQFGDRASE